MKPAIRTQVDGKGDYYSDLAAKTFNEPSLTRQEFAQEADVNYLMSRFGVNAPQRPVTWGMEIDTDLDLLQAYTTLDQLDRAWTTLPPEVRSQYGSWSRVIEAVTRGELKLADQDNTETHPKKDTSAGETDTNP